MHNFKSITLNDDSIFTVTELQFSTLEAAVDFATKSMLDNDELFEVTTNRAGTAAAICGDSGEQIVILSEESYWYDNVESNITDQWDHNTHEKWLEYVETLKNIAY